MKTLIRSLVLITSFGVSGTGHAEVPHEKDAKPGGIIGLSFETDSRKSVTRIMDEQASRPVKGGELSQAIYVVTQERIAETFSRPIPDSINESTRDD
ncbi:MAG: hypothetical protein RIK85_17585 [Marinobacter sp.]